MDDKIKEKGWADSIGWGVHYQDRRLDSLYDVQMTMFLESHW